jgi:SAM-dependent methyltransferase
LSFAHAAFAARLAVIETIIPPGSRILDIGCNDGRIASHLLATGQASHVTAVDLYDLIKDKPLKLNFVRADVADLDLSALGTFDIVLALNVLHHLVARSTAMAKDVLRSALEISSLALIDMGSFTERGPWGWRREYDRHWSDDTQIWDELFGAAPRHAVLRYAAMSGGHRVMWNIQGKSK